MRSGRSANHGGVFAAAHATDECVEAARAAAGRLLGAAPHDVAFGPSMTALTMRLAAAVGRTLGAGRRGRRHAARPRRQRAPVGDRGRARGATVRWAEPDRDTLALPAAAVEAVLSPRTRWVAVTATASNAMGTVPELERDRRRGPRGRRADLGRRRRGDAAPPHGPRRARRRHAHLLGLQVVRPARRDPVRRSGGAGGAAPGQAASRRPTRRRTAGSSARCRSRRWPA